MLALLKKFLDGLLFGAGFAISFVVIQYSIAYWMFPPTITSSDIEQVAHTEPTGDVEEGVSAPPGFEDLTDGSTPFHELNVDQQIEMASVIAVAEYQEADDGKMRAVITDFLKKEPDTTIYYDVGDEYPGASYYPEEGTSYGDGVIIFFVGSPASMRMSMTYEGDRIRGLADMPMKLLRQKCEEAKGA